MDHLPDSLVLVFALLAARGYSNHMFTVLYFAPTDAEWLFDFISERLVKKNKEVRGDLRHRQTCRCVFM